MEIPIRKKFSFKHGHRAIAANAVLDENLELNGNSLARFPSMIGASQDIRAEQHE